MNKKKYLSEVFQGSRLFHLIHYTNSNKGAGLAKSLVGTSLCGECNLPFDWNASAKNLWGQSTSPYISKSHDSNSKKFMYSN